MGNSCFAMCRQPIWNFLFSYFAGQLIVGFIALKKAYSNKKLIFLTMRT
jgi:hypothetical protein